MIGLALAMQWLVLLLLHVGLARLGSVLARLWSRGEAAAWRRKWPVRAALLAVGAPLVAGPWWVGPSGWVFLGMHLLLYGWLAFWAGIEARVAPGFIRRTTAVLHAVLSMEILAYLAWRGILQDGRASQAFAWVMSDVLGQVALPLLDRIPVFAEAQGFHEVLGFLVVRILSNVLGFLPVAASLGAWLVARVTISLASPEGAFAAPAPGDGRGAARLALVGVVLAVAARVLDPGGPLTDEFVCAGSVGASLLLVEGLSVVAGFLRGLRSRVLALALLGTLPLLVPVLGAVLVALGAMDAAFGGRDLRELGRAVPASSPLRLGTRSLLAGGILCTAVFGTLGALSDLAFLRTTPSAALADPCAGVSARRLGDGSAVSYVREDGTGFAIDVDEHRALPAGGATQVSDPRQAQAHCAAVGRRLCRSDEWYTACACGYRNTRTMDLLWWRPRRWFQDENLLERAQTECGAGKRLIGSRTFTGVPTGLPCESDHGVLDLLGGMVEVLEGAPGSRGVVLAGPTHALIEDWMVKCEYRAEVFQESLSALAPSFVGFRCCADLPPSEAPSSRVPGAPTAAW